MAGSNGPSVLKARGISHSTELRLLRIQHGGPAVVEEALKDRRGVLTGRHAPRRRKP